MKKRIACIFVAVLMIVILLPTAALAEDGNNMAKPQLVSVAGIAETSDHIQIDTASEKLTPSVESVPVIIHHSAMKESAEDSAALTLAYSFEPVGCKAKAVERTDVYTTGDSDGNVAAQIAVVKYNSTIATGIYTLTATVSRGDKSVSGTYTLEIIPEGAIVRYEYDASYYEGNPESVDGDFIYNFNKETGYYSDFEDAVSYSAKHKGTRLTLLQDDIYFGYTGIGNDVIIDANGHIIGSDDNFLIVDRRAYFANLTGTSYLMANSYINSDIEVMNVLDGFNSVVLKPDINYTARSSSRPLLTFNDGQHDAKNVAIYGSGYTAVDINGGIAIEKTTDRPFAILTGNSADTYKFVCYKSLSEAYDKAQQGDGYVYVLSYVNMMTGSSSNCNLYHYVGEVSEAQYAKLRTFIRITDGTKSEFYTVGDNGLPEFKYTNMPGTDRFYADDKMEDLRNDVETKATLNIPSEFADARAEGNVTITNDWTELNANTEEDKPIAEGGAYIIKGGYKIDVVVKSQGMFSTAKKMAFYSIDSGAVLNLTGANYGGGGNKNVDADLYGEYAAVSINNAIANIGTSVDYVGSCGLNKLTIDNKGFAVAGNEKTSVKLGTVELGANTFLSGNNVKLSSGEVADGNISALTVADTAFASLRDCEITANGIDGKTASLYGINNKGTLNINGGQMTVNGNGQKGTICGIYNNGHVSLGSDTDGNSFKLTMIDGSGVSSTGEKAAVEISEADVSLTGSDSVGIDVGSGSFSVRSGPYEYYPQSTEYSGVSVKAGDTALKIAEDVKWEISGSRNNVSFSGGNYAVDSKSAESTSDIVKFNMSYGRYYGDVRILDKTGMEAVKSALPILNFYAVQNKDGSISVRNAEGELRNFLAKDVNVKAEYTLPCYIYANFYQGTVFGCLIPDGNKAITVGQGEHVLHFSEKPYASRQISRCIIVDDVKDSCVIDIPKGAALTLDSGSWENQGIIVSAPATIINLHGGTFRNGQSGKDNGVFLSTGIYGELFNVGNLKDRNLSYMDIDEIKMAIYNGSGYCEMNGAICDGVVLTDGGTTEINDGAICAAAGEMYYGEDKGKLTINRAKFYGYYDLPDNKDWSAVFSSNSSAEERLIVGQQPGDNAIIPFGAKIKIEGSQEDWQKKLTLSETDPLHSLKMTPDCVFTVTAPNNPNDLADATVKLSATKVEVGTPVKVVSVVAGTDTLVEGKDYVVTFTKGWNTVGTNEVVITPAKGSKLTGSKTVTYESVKTVNAKVSKVTTAVKRGKKLKVTVKSNKSVVAYQYKYRVKGKSYGKVKTVVLKKSAKTATKTLKLKKGKRYYVRVRVGVKNGNGMIVYGSWKTSKLSKRVK